MNATIFIQVIPSQASSDVRTFVIVYCTNHFKLIVANISHIYSDGQYTKANFQNFTRNDSGKIALPSSQSSRHKHRDRFMEVNNTQKYNFATQTELFGYSHSSRVRNTTYLFSVTMELFLTRVICKNQMHSLFTNYCEKKHKTEIKKKKQPSYLFIYRAHSYFRQQGLFYDVDNARVKRYLIPLQTQIML